MQIGGLDLALALAGLLTLYYRRAFGRVYSSPREEARQRLMVVFIAISGEGNR